jgi:hypothetical protein
MGWAGARSRKGPHAARYHGETRWPSTYSPLLAELPLVRPVLAQRLDLNTAEGRARPHDGGARVELGEPAGVLVVVAGAVGENEDVLLRGFVLRAAAPSARIVPMLSASAKPSAESANEDAEVMR